MATYDRDEFISVPYTRTCKFCGEEGLEWFKNPTTGKYALYAYGQSKRHECRPPVAPIETASGVEYQNGIYSDNPNDDEGDK